MPRTSWLSLLLALSSAPLRPVVALGPWSHFLTEPEMRSSYIEIFTEPDDHSVLDPGYFFITPYVSDFKVGSFGPHIFKNDGTLIWNGNYTARIRAMDAHVCDYLGERGNHICYNDAKPVEQAGHSAGLIRFFDNTYTQVGPDFGAEGDLRAPDIHELNTPAAQNGETFIQDIYEIREMDLTPYQGPEKGFVLDGCFQEIEMRTKQVLFQWCALDHMPVWDTYMYLHEVHSPNYTLPIAGNGEPGKPWDFFHINAIAKNLEGDYAISGRHMNCIYKVAGANNVHGREPGSIIWRLGGTRNDFKMIDLNFSRQHTVRFHSTGNTESVISLFDNAFDGWKTTSKYSSGKLIRINNSTMEAGLIHQYDDPDKKLSFSQGSMQILDNGNVLMGWGNRHFYSEHAHDGKLLYHAGYTGGVESFRVWKFPWVGHPKTKPKIISYAFNCSAKLYAYVSWNGATEVTHWRFHTSWGTRYGPWHGAGVFEKGGFETMANFSSQHLKQNATFAPFVYVDALDKDGKVLESSEAVETFIPNASVVKKFQCNETMCAEPWFEFSREHSCSWECSHSHIAAFWVLIICVCTIELANWALTEFGWRWLAGRNIVRNRGVENGYANGFSSGMRNGPTSPRGATFNDSVGSGLSNLALLLGFANKDKPDRIRAHNGEDSLIGSTEGKSNRKIDWDDTGTAV